MKEHIFHFKGRGIEAGKRDDPCRIVECSDGAVMAITYVCHGVEFIQGYCRRAIIDPWGVFIHDPFRRASNATLTRSWAEQRREGLFLFRPTRLEIIQEQEWMRTNG